MTEELGVTRRIGLIGGSDIAQVLARSFREGGWEVLAWIDPARAELLDLARRLEVGNVSSRTRLVEWADVVFVSESDELHLEQHFAIRPDSLLSPRGRADVFIICGVFQPETLFRLEAKLKWFGKLLIESCLPAPVEDIVRKKAVVVCAGDQPGYERVKPILAALGREVIYLGEIGEATLLQGLVGLMIAIQTGALAQVLALADAAGVDLRLLRRVLTGLGLIGARSEEDWNVVLTHEYGKSCPASNVARSARSAVRLAKRMRLELPISLAAHRLFDRMIKLCLEQADRRAVA